MLGWMLLVGATPASAHAQMTSSNPKAKSIVYALPTSIKLMFTDDLIDLAGGNEIQVFDPRGKRIDLGSATVLGNQLTKAIKRSTLLGRYRVTYRVISEDSHPVSASFVFQLAKKTKK
jgi:copper transport protein